MSYNNHNPGIYLITNTISGDKYVGSTARLPKRIGEHKRKLRLNTHVNPHLQASYNKYSLGAFRFEVLLKIDINDFNPDMLLEWERIWMCALKPEFNCGGVGPTTLGSKRTVAQCQAVSNRMRQNPQVWTEERRAMMRKYAKSQDCSHLHSKETRQKISNAIARKRAQGLLQPPPNAVSVKTTDLISGKIKTYGSLNSACRSLFTDPGTLKSYVERNEIFRGLRLEFNQ